jgi:hypothetical protein
MIEQCAKKLISSGRIVGDPFSDSGAQLNLGISASYVWDICAKMTRACFKNRFGLKGGTYA